MAEREIECETRIIDGRTYILRVTPLSEAEIQEARDRNLNDPLLAAYTLPFEL